MRSLRRISAIAFASLALAAGCGGDDNETENGATTAAVGQTPPQANAAYERAYSECASFPLKRLAAELKVRANRAVVARAMGDAWAKRLGGGQAVASYGEAGCKEGFKARAGGGAA